MSGRERKVWIQASCTVFKYKPCVAFCYVGELGKYTLYMNLIQQMHTSLCEYKFPMMFCPSHVYMYVLDILKSSNLKNRKWNLWKSHKNKINKFINLFVINSILEIYTITSTFYWQSIFHSLQRHETQLIDIMASSSAKRKKKNPTKFNKLSIGSIIRSTSVSSFMHFFFFFFSFQLLCKYGWFGLVGFFGISIIFGYLKPNPVFTNTLNIWFVNTFWRYTQLNDQTVLFLTTQFIRSTKLNGSKYYYVSLTI